MSELRKPKSPGLVSSVNAAGLGAADTSRRFQEASAAFIHPARNPTRGSGRGAVGDISNFVAVAQAATTVPIASRSEEHTSELQSRLHLVCRLLLEKKKQDH